MSEIFVKITIMWKSILDVGFLSVFGLTLFSYESKAIIFYFSIDSLKISYNYNRFKKFFIEEGSHLILCPDYSISFI